MKRVVPIILLFALSGCYKDEVDIAALTTNPCDPDYTGAAFIEVVGEQTEPIIGGVYKQTLLIEVDNAVLNATQPYQLNVLEVGTGEVTKLPQTAPGSHAFTYTNFTVTLGAQYCYRISAEVQFSTTRSEEFCAVAQL